MIGTVEDTIEYGNSKLFHRHLSRGEPAPHSSEERMRVSTDSTQDNIILKGVLISMTIKELE